MRLFSFYNIKAVLQIVENSPSDTEHVQYEDENGQKMHMFHGATPFVLTHVKKE